MNRRTALSIVCIAAAAAAALAADKAQGQTYPNLTIYAGPGGPGYNASTQLMTALPYGPGMTAGNGVGIGATTSQANRSIAAFRFDSSGNVAMLAPLGVDSVTGAYMISPYAINAAGVSVGTSTYYGNSTVSGSMNAGTEAVMWNAAGKVTALQNLGPVDAYGNAYGLAFAINAGGIATGTAYQASGQVGQFAVRWDTTNGGAITPLTPLSTAGSFTDVGNAINTAGAVVGYATQFSGTSSLGPRATLWAAGGTAATQLATLPNTPAGATFNATFGGASLGPAQANAVNDFGVSVGIEPVFDVYQNFVGQAAVRWTSTGAATQLAPLGTGNPGAKAVGASQSTANAINVVGTAVGVSTKYANSGTASAVSAGNRATIWAATGSSAAELPSLIPAGNTTITSTISSADSINDDGLVVGSATAYNSAGGSLGLHATLWVPNLSSGGYSAIDLNSLLSSSDTSNYVLLGANSISNTDWVTALAQNPSTGFREEVLFSVAAEDPAIAAVPEPTSMVLLASATAAPLLSRRRRRRQGVLA